MIKIIGILSLASLMAHFSAIGQIVRGNLLNEDIPVAIDSFFQQKQIQLTHLRKTTAFLTNRDIKNYQGYKVAKRKKAFIRHVKHLSEQLEYYYQENEAINPEISEIAYELFLLEESLKEKTISKGQTKVPFKDKARMILDSYRSKRVFKYRILENNPPNLEVANSPFYHQADSIPLHKRFGQLAKLKKIDAEKNMVVLFKELSLSGSAPKIRTLDLDLDNEWSLKWGDEVHADVVGSRIFAALGYDVDHPYFYEKDKLTLVFEGNGELENAEALIRNIKEIYEIDLRPFISNYGLVSKKMAEKNKDLKPFVGMAYVRFLKCAIEARPDRVKRLGSFLPEIPLNQNRRELKGAVLAHHFIGNWDTREANTLLTTVHMGNYNYRISAVFSDLGTSMGVTFRSLPADFKVGLVNQLPWEVVKRKGKKIQFTNKLNSILPAYQNAEYEDLHWMAQRIAQLSEESLRKMIKKGGWPEPISELYFHKMASRRASILAAFEIVDPHPIEFDRKLTISQGGVVVVKNGVLIRDYQRELNPESFIKKKGRLRNYGN